MKNIINLHPRKPSTVSRRAMSLTTSSLALFAAVFGTSVRANPPLPTGGNVVTGSAVIDPTLSGVTINQTSNRAVINWNTFDVGLSHNVTFIQPNASSATLNRVTGGTGSTIAGQISATGSVYLINPNGIQITSMGAINVGRGFVASTLDIANADFMAGKGSFSGGTGTVSNAGTITTQSGGYVGLLGGNVSNSGMIVAPAGKVVLAAGTSATFDLNGDGFLSVALLKTAALFADGSLVALTPAQAQAAVRDVVNLPPEINAQSLTTSNGNVILSGSINTDSAIGNGGHILVLGDKVIANGSLSAKATGAAGDGGLVETSGNSVDFKGLNVNTSAAHGKTGTWLVDPSDLIVYASDAATINNNLATSNVTLQTTADGTNSGPGTASSGPGNIIVRSALSWTSSNTLTLDSTNYIFLYISPITAPHGGLTISGHGGVIAVYAAVSVGNFTLQAGDWQGYGANIYAFTVSNNFSITGGTFLRTSGGDGSRGDPFLIGDVYGLQGMASLRGASFALSGNIDASGTSTWNAGAGFAPIGSLAAPFIGSLDGQNRSITGVTINNSTLANVGLFGVIGTGGSVSRLNLVGGSVFGTATVGGLAGKNDGSISASSSNTNVSATGGAGADGSSGILGFSQTGGNAGNGGSVVVGGLVGNNTGTLSQDYTTGATNGTGGNGGAGGNGSDGSFFSPGSNGGNGGLGGSADSGGLVGNNTGVISISYATGAVRSTGGAGGTLGSGGLAGLGLGGFGNGTNGSAGNGGSIIGGGLVGSNAATISQVYATSAVIGSGGIGGGLSGTATLGGLIGSNSGTVLNSFWDTGTSGQATSAGGLALTTAQIRTLGTFTTAGWSIDAAGGTASVWRIYGGQTAPLLRTFLTPLTITASSNTLIYDGAVHAVTGYVSSINAATLLGAALETGGTGTNAGTYAHSVAGLYSNQRGYDIALASGSLMIKPATVVITAVADANATYGTLATLGAATLTGVVAADSSNVFGTVGLFAGFTPITLSGTTNAGAYSEKVTGLTGGASANYIVAATGNATGTLTIAPRALTLAAGAQARTYGAANPTTDTALVQSGTSLVNGDTVGGVSVASAAIAASNIGSYNLLASNAQFSSGLASNYQITYADAPTALTITPAMLSIAYIAAPVNSIYGNALPVLTGTTSATGLANGDNVGTVTSGTARFTTTAGSTSKVGSYAITGSGLASASDNYVLTISQALANATALQISPRGVTVTANTATSIYGATVPALTYAVGTTTANTGLVNGDILSGALTSGAGATVNAGQYAINLGTLGNANYTVTYNGATLTFTPAALRVLYTAFAATSIYGNAIPALTGSTIATGLANSDTLANISTGTATFSTTATSATGVGPYAINGAGLAFATNNYTVSVAQAPGNTTALTITPRTIVVTADPQSRYILLNNPTLTYKVGGLGLVNGDKLTGQLSTTAQPLSPTGTYPIALGTVAASANYNVSYVGAKLTVSPPPTQSLSDFLAWLRLVFSRG